VRLHCSAPLVWFVLGVAALGCHGQSETEGAGAGGTSGGGRARGGVGTGVAGEGGSSGASGLVWTAGANQGGAAAFELSGAPLLFAPTATSVGINVVLASGSPEQLFVRIRAAGDADWTAPIAPGARGADLAAWTLDDLSPNTRYEYQVVALFPQGESVLHAGSVHTQRPAGEPFTFSLLTDSHIGADLSYANQGIPETLIAVAADIASDAPDFMVNLGDMLDFHQYGFNVPPPDGTITRLAYLNYRTLLSPALGHIPHFAVIGNWEGENGDYAAEEIAWSREQRLLYMPNPEPTTYPEGGSPHEDYYAFTWGDALFVVLNVMTYTPTTHLLSYDPGVPDDWTLGEEQFAWFEETLKGATSKWRFVLIHHAVGGASPSANDAAYGRGGGQAAYVGEQALIHQLMIDHGVQVFFYGHDHVFTDMIVDGIHYSMPGNAGAPWMFTSAETGYEDDVTWVEPGHARVDVAPSGVDVQFLGVGNTLLYSYRLE
jgi:hypothetical protein